MISLRDNFNPVKREEIRERGREKDRQTEKEEEKTLLNYVC